MTIKTLLQLLTIGMACYLLIIFVLRISGKRTLSKMNSFDFIVTVALGSVLASTLVNYKTVLWEGIVTFCMLVFFQFLSSWLAGRSDTVNSLIKSQPTLLFYEGKYDRKNMRKERVSENEITQAIRSKGTESTESVSAVVLETDGTLSVLKKQKGNSSQDTLEEVRK